MADAAVDLTQDNQSMINALKKIATQHETEILKMARRAYRKAAFILIRDSFSISFD